MARRRVLWTTLLILAAGSPAARAQALVQAEGAECAPRRSGLAVGQALGVNLFVNRLDAWVLGEETQRVSFETWARNLRQGWEWDENGFSTNLFSHPIHGAQYFNAGRANCLSFWSSIPLVFLGSWTWEYLGETNRPSLNDFFMTSLGGIALGEMTHRLAATIRDERAQGGARISREILAMLVDPLAGLNRLFRGDWKRVGSNSPGHDQQAFNVQLKLGGRWVGKDTTGVCEFCPTLLIDVHYGDPFDESFEKPFDVFQVHAQVSPDGGGLNALEAAGRLYEINLNSRDSRRQHALTVTQRFAYQSYTEVFDYGAQSLEVGLLSRLPLPRQWQLNSRFSGDVVIMGAVGAPLGGVGERTYDFGPGAGFGTEFEFWRRGTRILSLRNRAEYLYTVSGVPAEHLVTFSKFELEVPVARAVGLGFALDVNTRTSSYDALDDDTLEFAEVRFFLSWRLDR